jgi:hypothetical protein
MYNNANVLFKTSFVDGVSKVDRYVLKMNKKKKKNRKKTTDILENNLPV